MAIILKSFIEDYYNPKFIVKVQDLTNSHPKMAPDAFNFIINTLEKHGNGYYLVEFMIMPFEYDWTGSNSDVSIMINDGHVVNPRELYDLWKKALYDIASKDPAVIGILNSFLHEIYKILDVKEYLFKGDICDRLNKIIGNSPRYLAESINPQLADHKESSVYNPNEVKDPVGFLKKALTGNPCMDMRINGDVFPSNIEFCLDLFGDADDAIASLSIIPKYTMYCGVKLNLYEIGMKAGELVMRKLSGNKDFMEEYSGLINCCDCDGIDSLLDNLGVLIGRYYPGIIMTGIPGLDDMELLINEALVECAKEATPEEDGEGDT